MFVNHRNFDFHMTKRTHKGFTLIELMTTMAVVAILAAVAAPSMKTFLRKQSMVGEVSTFYTGLAYARSEAAAFTTEVTICSSNDGATCSGNNDWSDGWIVAVVDPDDCPEAGCILKITEGGSHNVSNLGTVNQITFDSQGVTDLDAAGARFVVCADQADPDIDEFTARTITVRRSGIRSISVGALACP